MSKFKVGDKVRALDALIEAANAGYRAVEKLEDRYNDDCEWRHKGSEFDTGSNWRPVKRGKEVRRKPKPVFEEFAIGSWRVFMDPKGNLFIGCKQFSAKEMKHALTQIVKNGSDRIQVNATPINVVWGGVNWGGYPMDKNDVEKLLAALEKAGI